MFFDDFSVKLQAKPLEVLYTADYYPYGEVMREWKHADLDKHRYGYQGDFAEKDAETGFSHFELRDYDSKIGRWLVPDPMREFWSPYVGMGNNPVNLTDPDGGESESPIINKDTGVYMGNDSEGWNGEVIFMDAADFVEGMDHNVVMNMVENGRAFTLTGNSGVTMTMQSWSNFFNFVATSPNGNNWNPNELTNGIIHIAEYGNGDGIVTFRTALMSSVYKFANVNPEQGNMLIWANIKDGKLKPSAPVSYWYDVVSSLVHEKFHTGDKSATNRELRAVEAQQEHWSWDLTSSKFRNYSIKYGNNSEH